MTIIGVPIKQFEAPAPVEVPVKKGAPKPVKTPVKV